MKIQTLMYCPKCTMQFQVVEPEIIAESRKKTCRCPECFLSFSHGQNSKYKVAVCVTPEVAEMGKGLKLIAGEWRQGNRSMPGGTT
jgi:uncharacterized Zn finger protein